MKINRSIKKKLIKIKLVIADIDGVLTDGRLYFNGGEEIKSFNVKDGIRVKLAIKHGIKIVWLTGRKCKAVIQRSREFNGVKLIFRNNLKSPTDLFEILKKKEKIHPTEILYIGDDLNDIFMMNRVGISVTPRDGSNDTKKIADIITDAKGGEGVLGEIIEVIMREKGIWAKSINEKYSL